MDQETVQQQEVPMFMMPQSVEELEELLRQLGQVERNITRIKDRTDRRIAKVKADGETDLQPYKLLHDALTAVIFPYIRANWNQLVAQYGTPKELRLKQATIKWHVDTKGSLTIVGDDEDAAIKEIESLPGGLEFIEIKKTIKKEPIKKWRLLSKLKSLLVIYKDSMTIVYPETDSDKRRGRKAPSIKRNID